MKDLYHDYSTMLYSIQAKHEKTSFEVWQDVQFRNAQGILDAVDYKNERVRNLGANYAISNFQDYQYFHQNCFMILSWKRKVFGKIS